MVGRIARVKWAAHGKEISAHLFSIFKNTDAESDCLLSCAGGRLFPAHRIVLAMASPFFSAIFDSVPPNAVSPLIVLDGVEADQVEALMQYMYSGYSIVKCEKLPALCRIAKALGIKEFPSLEIAPPVKRPFNEEDAVEISNGKSYLQKDARKNELDTHHKRSAPAYQNNARSELEVISDSRNVRRKLDSGIPAEKTVEQNYQINQRPIQSSNSPNLKAGYIEPKRVENYPVKIKHVSENPRYLPNAFVFPKSLGLSYGKPLPEHSTTSKGITSFSNSRLREALHSSAPSQHSKRQWNGQIEPRRIKLEETPELVDVCSVSDDEATQDEARSAKPAALQPSNKLQKPDDGILPKASPGLPVQKTFEQCTSARSFTEPVRSASPPPAQSPAHGAGHRPSSLPSIAVQPLSTPRIERKQDLPQLAGPQNLDPIHQMPNGPVIPQKDKKADQERTSSSSSKSIIYVPTPVYAGTSFTKMPHSQPPCNDISSYAVSPFTPRESDFGRAKGENTQKEESAVFKGDKNDKRNFYDVETHQMPMTRERIMSNCDPEHDAKMNQFYKQRPPALLHIVNRESSSSAHSQSRHSSFSSELPVKTSSDEVYNGAYQSKNVPYVPNSGHVNASVTAPGSHSFPNSSKVVHNAPNLPSMDVIQLDERSDVVSKPNGERNDNLPPTSDSTLFDLNAPPNVPCTTTCPVSTIPQSVNNSSGDFWKPPEQNSLHEYGEHCDSSPEHGTSDPLLTKISTTKRRRVRGPKSWEFLLRLLRDPTTNPSLIRWENESEGVFRLVKPDAIALRWGKRTGKHFTEMLSYENFARGLRYHYVTGALSAVSERCFVYKFGPKAEPVLKSPEKLYDFSGAVHSYE